LESTANLRHIAGVECLYGECRATSRLICGESHVCSLTFKRLLHRHIERRFRVSALSTDRHSSYTVDNWSQTQQAMTPRIFITIIARHDDCNVEWNHMYPHRPTCRNINSGSDNFGRLWKSRPTERASPEINAIRPWTKADSSLCIAPYIPYHVKRRKAVVANGEPFSANFRRIDRSIKPSIAVRRTDGLDRHAVNHRQHIATECNRLQPTWNSLQPPREVESGPSNYIPMWFE